MSPPTAAIVMSRIPRLITPDAAWLGGLRAALRRIASQRQTLLIAPGTAGSEFIQRGALRLGIPLRVIATDLNKPEVTAQPPPDRELIRAADEVYVLKVRPRGNVFFLLAQRLSDGHRGVILVDAPKLQSMNTIDELQRLGSEVWTPPDSMLAIFADSATDATAVPTSPNDILSFGAVPPDQADDFLTHTTRECPGPWPGQAWDDYLDCLLDARPDGDHSALNTLRRIVSQKRLIASGRTIRGGFPMVSFTAVGIGELPGLTCFRSHRTRWDFEPYAISIRRQALEQAGARPVIYGTDDTWNQLSPPDRPFFQSSGGEIDWTVEREWRHPGDLDLTQFSTDDVILFVPNVAATRRIQPITHWPIALWPADVTEFDL